MEAQAARARKQLQSLQLHQKDAPSTANAQKQDGPGPTPRGELTRRSRHDSERASLEQTEQELTNLRAEIKSIEQWLVHHGAEIKPAAPSHPPRRPAPKEDAQPKMKRAAK